MRIGGRGLWRLRARSWLVCLFVLGVIWLVTTEVSRWGDHDSRFVMGISNESFWRFVKAGKEGHSDS